MRIVGGRLRGKKLVALPPGEAIRPSSDRLREALFNILMHGPHGAPDGEPAPAGWDVLDGFAGSGAVGLEALSRGARSASFLETDPRALEAIRANVRACGLAEAAHVLPRNATKPGRAQVAHQFCFLDPPYRSGLAAPALAALAENGWLADGALVAVEIGRRDPFEAPPGFDLVDDRRYGAARLLLLLRSPQRR